MFLDSSVLQYTMIGFLAIGTFTVLGLLGLGIKRFCISLKNKSVDRNKFGLGIVDDIRRRIERDDSDADVMFHLLLNIIPIIGFIIAVAFWIEKLVQFIF